MKKFKINDTVWFVDVLHNNPMDYKVKSGRYQHVKDGTIKVRETGTEWYVDENGVFDNKEKAEQALADILIEEAADLEEQWKRVLRRAVELFRV